MTARRRRQAIPVLVVLIGLTILAGWYAGIPELHSGIPGWASAKETTGCSFVLLGLALLAFYRHSDSAVVVVFSGLTMVLMFSSLMAEMFNDPAIQIGRIKEVQTPDCAYSLPGVPSVFTIGLFAAYSLALIDRVIVHSDRLPRWLHLSAFTIGTTGLVGYMIDAPRLYGTFDGWSGAMGAITCFTFQMIGLLGFRRVGRRSCRSRA